MQCGENVRRDLFSLLDAELKNTFGFMTLILLLPVKKHLHRFEIEAYFMQGRMNSWKDWGFDNIDVFIIKAKLVSFLYEISVNEFNN